MRLYHIDLAHPDNFLAEYGRQFLADDESDNKMYRRNNYLIQLNGVTAALKKFDGPDADHPARKFF